MKKRIELCDEIYKLRHGVAEEKIFIGEVTELHAKSKDLKYKFNRYEIDPILPIQVQYGYTNIFGESYILKTPENEQMRDREIKIRIIRNYKYSLLTDQQINEILEVIKTNI